VESHYHMLAYALRCLAAAPDPLVEAFLALGRFEWPPRPYLLGGGRHEQAMLVLRRKRLQSHQRPLEDDGSVSGRHGSGGVASGEAAAAGLRRRREGFPGLGAAG
jgi:hypothetical protein